MRFNESCLVVVVNLMSFLTLLIVPLIFKDGCEYGVNTHVHAPVLNLAYLSLPSAKSRRNFIDLQMITNFTDLQLTVRDGAELFSGAVISLSSFAQSFLFLPN